MTQDLDSLCRKAKITLEALSEQSGLDIGKTQAIFLGRWTPSPEERQKIAGALQVSVDEITWGHKTPIQHIYGHGPN